MLCILHLNKLLLLFLHLFARLAIIEYYDFKELVLTIRRKASGDCLDGRLKVLKEFLSL